MLSTTEPFWAYIRRTRHRWSAERLLTRFNQTRPPVQVERLARDMGLSVRYRSMPYAGELKLDRDANYAVIVVNDADHPRRQRFTIAHEIGHLMLHPGSLHWRDTDFKGDDKEAQANGYAAALLMPFSMLKTYAPAYRFDAAALADLFGVSERSMEIRLMRMAGVRKVYRWEA